MTNALCVVVEYLCKCITISTLQIEMLVSEPKPLTLIQWLWIRWTSISLNNIFHFLDPTEIIIYRIL